MGARFLEIAVGMAVMMPCNPAQGCSMVSGYKVPTTLELAAKAEVIVVATLVEERKGEDAWSSVVLARPTALVKGGVLPSSIEIAGAQLGSDDRLVVASRPRELRRPNPGALIGGCVRYVFGKGAQLLLFLTRNEAGAMVPYRSAFSRDSEDVTGVDALWVKAVREYATISAAPRAEWPDRLRKRIAELRAEADEDSAAIAADMSVELDGRRLPPFD